MVGVPTVPGAPGPLRPDARAEAATALDPGTAAGVLVYENLWAAPFAAALRRSGGQLVAAGHIPVQDLVATLDALEAEEQASTGPEPAQPVG